MLPNTACSGLAGTVRHFGQLSNPPTANANRWAALCSKRKYAILLNNIIFRRFIMSRIKSAHSSKDQAHLIIEQNIQTIINPRRVTANQRTTEERLADTVTNFLEAHVF
jgi:hypothetical protein